MASLYRVIFMILITLVLATPSFAAENSDLLPDHQTPIIDLAKSLSKEQRANLETSLSDYEKNTGWKI